MTTDATKFLELRRGDVTGTPLDLPVREESTYNHPDMSPGDFPERPGGQPVTAGSWETTYALAPLTDYIAIRLPGRGPDGTTLTYRFLVNPASIDVQYQTIDSQAFTRGGWQFGVWGEDVVQISMQGKTAGAYFNNGLTDAYRRYSASYRNILELQKVFENNGYWFEGEEAEVSPMLSRKLIQYHEDVQLVYNNFIWYGMFVSLTAQSTADTPYLDTFQLEFMAWKERYRASSPWRDSLHNDVVRGHTMGAWENLGLMQSYADGKRVSTSFKVEDLPTFPAPKTDTSALLLSPGVTTPLPPPGKRS